MFADQEIEQSCAYWKATPVGKFMDKEFLLDFIQKEMMVRWNIEGKFQISFFSEGVLMFDKPSEETQAQILARGLWSLASKLLALESWCPNFNPCWDDVHQLREWIR